MGDEFSQRIQVFVKWSQAKYSAVLGQRGEILGDEEGCDNHTKLDRKERY
jgi:hypothetical protein